MTYNFLWLVNRLCQKLNEVELTSTTFSSAAGVYNDFKESVNAAIYDIYTQEDIVWPFAYVNTTFDTVIGQSEYSKHANAQVVDWESFYIKKLGRTPTSITSVGTTATVTDAGHPHVTGDRVYITGATQDGYNGYVYVTVLSSSQFTYTVASGLVTPATGTITIYPQYSTLKLTNIDFNTYLEENHLEIDGEAITASSYGKPKIVARKPDNNFILSTVPDRIYTVSYNYYTAPTDLEEWNDLPNIPELFKHTVVDGAMYHAYMFRDNVQEASKAEAKFADGINTMRRILIPQPTFMRIDESIAN